MHTLRPLAILLAICSIPAVLGWGFLTLFGAWGLWVSIRIHLVHPGMFFIAGLLFLGWTSLAALFWTVRHFAAFIAPTPRWVVAGYLFCALVLVLMLSDVSHPYARARDMRTWLMFFTGPACLLLLALWRLWQIRRFYAINIAQLHQNSACGSDADGTLVVPIVHPATPCSSDPPASSR